MKKIILIVTLLFVSVSCNNNETEITNKEAIENEEEFIYEASKSAERISLIDGNLKRLVKIESLSWELQTENQGSKYVQLEAYLDETGFPVKIIEYFNEGDFQSQGQRNYYLEDNKIIGFLEQQDKWLDSNISVFQEKRTIYEEGIPKLTQIREANYFGEIEDVVWKSIPIEANSLKRVQDILTGEGRFKTHFISVIKGEQLFLLLGENKPEVINRYTTAVMVEKETPFISDLLANLEKYKYRPVKIDFKVIGGDNQFEFRVLTDIAWID